MPWMIRAAVEAAKAWSSGLVQAAPPSGVCRWFAALQLKAKRESDSVSGSPRRLKFTSWMSCPSSGSPFPGEKPKSPSRATSAAPFFTTPRAKESGAKSGPTTATSAGSIASGLIGGCGKKASTWRTGVSFAITVAAGCRSSPGPLRVEDGLRRVEVAEPVRPAVVVGRAVTIHLRELQAVRRVVRRACAALVLAVLRHEEAALEGMVFGSEA